MMTMERGFENQLGDGNAADSLQQKVDRPSFMRSRRGRVLFGVLLAIAISGLVGLLAGKTTTNLNREPSITTTRRYLQEMDFQGGIDNVSRMIGEVFSTPIADWEMQQWIVCIILLLIVSTCCCGGSRGYNRGYYNYGRGGGGSGCCGCGCQDILMCVCCYEICCRDCADVERVMSSLNKEGNDSGEGAVYQGGEMV